MNDYHHLHALTQGKIIEGTPTIHLIMFMNIDRAFEYSEKQDISMYFMITGHAFHLPINVFPRILQRHSIISSDILS